ncbi:MAG: HD domain-containing protein [Bacillota bacterium]|nr:HD domain-containing protein [Bacillota bacterium]
MMVQDIFFSDCVDEILSTKEFLLMEAFLQHGKTTCLGHCLKVAGLSYIVSKKLNLRCDNKSLIRGALLHDFFLYDWHEKDASHRLHGFSHPKTALRNAELYFTLNNKERDIIAKHMWPLTLKPPKCREAFLVCVVDKCCAAFETFSPLFSKTGVR